MSSAPPATGTASLHRCEQCGVESCEPTCFVPATRRSKRRHGLCWMCAQSASSSTKKGVWQLLPTTLSPLLLLFMLRQWDVEVFTLPVLLGALLIQPIAIVAHELGHALVGKLLGLEIGAITIGSGTLVWRFELGSTPIHIHAWPLSGLVHLGSPTTQWLRTRAWLATAAGPLTNVGLMVAAAKWSEPLQSLFGADLLTLWHITNFFLFLASILPGSSEIGGQSHHSDGSQLLSIPQAPVGYMDLYLTSALAMRSASLFSAGDFIRAKAAAERALERAPDSHVARVMIAANASSLGKYTEALDALTPLLPIIDMLDAPTKATIRNDMAFALTMSSAAARSTDDKILQTAEQLSADAFFAYPCALAYRSTRALVLTAVGRPLEALELLRYMHYESASAMERGHRESVRALALHRLGNTNEARDAASAARELNPAMNDLLNVLLEVP